MLMADECPCELHCHDLLTQLVSNIMPLASLADPRRPALARNIAAQQSRKLKPCSAPLSFTLSIAGFEKLSNKLPNLTRKTAANTIHRTLQDALSPLWIQP